MGRTNRNVQDRFDEHRSGQGSEWTRRFGPLEIDKVLKEQSRFDEDKYVTIYMENFGIDNVRGGSYSNVVLTAMQRETLERELRNAADTCLQCGRSGHFVSVCPTLSVESRGVAQRGECCRGVTSRGVRCQSYLYINREGYCPSHQDQHEQETTTNVSFPSPVHELPSKPYKRQRTSGACHRCGRRGHKASECFARTDIQGYALSSDDEDSGDEDSESDDEEGDDRCFRCKRLGHRVSDCYARTASDGYSL